MGDGVGFSFSSALLNLVGFILSPNSLGMDSKDYLIITSLEDMKNSKSFVLSVLKPCILTY